MNIQKHTYSEAIEKDYCIYGSSTNIIHGFYINIYTISAIDMSLN